MICGKRSTEWTFALGVPQDLRVVVLVEAYAVIASDRRFCCGTYEMADRGR